MSWTGQLDDLALKQPTVMARLGSEDNFRRMIEALLCYRAAVLPFRRSVCRYGTCQTLEQTLTIKLELILKDI